MSAAEILSALDRIHGTVSVIGSMNADYTVTAQRLPGPGETITGGPLQLLPGGNAARPEHGMAFLQPEKGFEKSKSFSN